jgi:hypothetical protein
LFHFQIVVDLVSPVAGERADPFENFLPQEGVQRTSSGQVFRLLLLGLGTWH